MPRRLTPAGRRPLVLHPFLLAAYPVLFLYGANAGEVPIGDVVAPLVVVVSAVAALVAVLWAGLRDLPRAGLVGSTLALSFLGYGHIANVLGPGRAVLAGWLALTAGLVVLAIRARRGAPQVTTILNLVGAALVAITLVTVAPAALTALAQEGGPPATPTVAGPGRAGPDIYYIVLDRYGGAETLEREFGFDNRSFLEILERNHFFLARRSHANYLKSAQSLASSLNMAYHHEELAQAYGSETDNLLPVYERLATHRVGAELRRRGYEYVHIGSWWDPTAQNPVADVNLGYQGRSDFTEVLYDTTIASSLGEGLGLTASDGGHRRRHYEAAVAQFDALDAVRDRPGPTFVFAHILLPHEPYVFDPDGDYVPASVEASRTRAENFTGQLRYLNRRLVAFLEPLVDRPEDERPVVVLQGDEGPHPVRYTSAGQEGYDWTRAPLEDLREKFHILNAYLLPGVEHPMLAETITPVNTFRVILNAYFNAGLPLLEDRSYVFRDTRHPYDYAEVTERLRR